MTAAPGPVGRGEAIAFEGEGTALSFDAIACPPPPLRGIEPGAAVALHLADPVKLAWALAHLGGRAGRLVLVAADTAPALLAPLLAEAGADLLLTDRDGLPALPARALRWDGLAEPTGPALPPVGIETEWVLATSGTTGAPKLVQHGWASLTRTVRRGGAPQRWGQVYNLCRFAGLQVFVQSLLSRSTLVLPRLDRPLAEQVATLARGGVTALSATPTLWRKILMLPESASLPLRQVTLGGEIADGFILGALAERFPRARVVHIYASTEAGAAFSVKDGLPGFPAAYLDPGSPAGALLEVREGRLFVHNGGVRPGYLGGARFADERGFVDTGDMVERRGDRFHFLGRANGMINVGGNKLYPEEVENVLLAHPAIRFARVAAQRSPIMGQLVTAEVVPAAANAPDPAGGRELVKALRHHCQDRLEPWKVPALIRVVAALGPNAGGKLERRPAGRAA
ncbi:long-chain fatty acid--CoA ligase [Roseomonas nepalensis]|uniref:Long-chain-fatty-acid--CoA ligase n=1 Tax=Muricoccus nepalensis TaxID=1854500 RepID=A0A502G5J7_9PROT|nr:fatty acid--CoA ligase family protein [Roseomonas nepalensis]TPG56882.1 long-chain fatty acid--CoA ligase [Roseomonas nepalensis]